MCVVCVSYVYIFVYVPVCVHVYTHTLLRIVILLLQGGGGELPKNGPSWHHIRYSDQQCNLCVRSIKEFNKFMSLYSSQFGHAIITKPWAYSDISV